MFRKCRNGIIIGLLVVMAGALAFRPSDGYFEMAKSLDIMASVYRDLNLYYVDSVDPARLMQTGIEAMTESLDPYTYYFSEDDLGDLDFQTTGKYGGVGTSVRRTGDSIVVTDVLANAPFAKAGIRPGDVILKLDGKAAPTLSLEQISGLLKGDPGTGLDITIRHPFTGKATRLQITRQQVDIRGVAYVGLAADSIGYVKMIQFTQGVAGEMARAVKTLKKEHPAMKGLVIDLRGNPGGLLNEAVKTANLFIPIGDTILTTRGRVSEWNRVYRATATPLDSHIPLAVLVDDHSASASEIVAGAIQDLDRGVVVGRRSFGKGLVQTTRNLPYHTTMKITTAKYDTPSGRCIQAIDYAHRGEDGSIAYIPDSLKRDFHTRDGRMVMDGGGIAPDQLVPRKPLSNIATSLITNHLIFDYATRYYYRHRSHSATPVAGKFRLSGEDFEGFIRFLKDKDYSYKTRTELALERFKSVAEKEGYFKAVGKDYQALQQRLTHDKRQDLLKHKVEITRLLEAEIMSRYYFQSGRITQRLPTDPAVLAAVNLLDNHRQYQKLLHVAPQ
jgi:carboxyl-terminal processing protease